MNCTNLIELHLGDNNLEGDISALNFSKLNQLRKLDLWSNNFTGTIPVSLYSCNGNKWTNITGAMKILMRCESLVFIMFSYSFIGEEIPADDGLL
ncbi:receptor-like protein 2 [Prunus yedoensis var. nudiflora]|uniref:Receptor-like protein 2 n=1 Tax=Prunus yedoensis var. nudiflora TaxID=2094558 RepID=A0A314UY77_PRUYE|nr:receptor-like protein 2 [Prunus yedoensis var. nudiflora]